MFQCARIQDDITLECSEIGEYQEETWAQLRKAIRAKYADRVVPGLGLCITLIELLEVSGLPILSPNDGRPCFSCEFQVLMFTPVNNEVIYGTIAEADPLGIRVKLGDFFHDLKVLSHQLPQPSAWDENAGLWYWEVDGSDGTTTKLYFEIGSSCRLRVIDTIYNNSQTHSNDTPNETNSATAPLFVLGSMQEQGLGLDAWWQ